MDFKESFPHVVFPMYVGVILNGKCYGIRTECIPHVCGGNLEIKELEQNLRYWEHKLATYKRR